MRRATALRTPVALVALAALAAACSRGSETPGTRAQPASTTTAHASGATCWSAPIASSAASPDETFVDATDDLGLDEPLKAMFVHASALGDVDGDGWLDLFVGSFGDRPAARYAKRGADGPSPDRLLRGGPGGFTVDSSFPELRGRTSGAVFTDLDGDGDLDLALARNLGRRSDEISQAPSVVLVNDGGAFGEPRPIPAGKGARAVVPLDVDSDGDLDLFIAGDDVLTAADEDDTTPAVGTSRLLRNEGGFHFVDATRASGLPADLTGYGAVAADLSGDGRRDLVVAGDNRLFVADERGRFHDATPKGFAWKTFGAEDIVTGVAVGDLDRDGRPDVAMGHHYGSTIDLDRRVPIRVWRNAGPDDAGDPRLIEITATAGIPSFATKAPHVALDDFDDDGAVDLLVTASAARGTLPTLLRNRGGDTVRFEAPAGLGDPQYWVTGSVGDVDHDGRLDVFLGEFEPAKPSRLLLGRGRGHWLAIDVSDQPLGGIGSIVRAYEPGRSGDDDALIARIDVVGTSGYAGGDPPIAHIGLGDATSADVVVERPGGARTDYGNVRADQLVRAGGCTR
jgi:hypothetical protein